MLDGVRAQLTNPGGFAPGKGDVASVLYQGGGGKSVNCEDVLGDDDGDRSFIFLYLSQRLIRYQEARFRSKVDELVPHHQHVNLRKVCEDLLGDYDEVRV